MENEKLIEKMAKFFDDLEKAVFSRDVVKNVLDGYADDEIEGVIAAIKYLFMEEKDSFMSRWLKAYLSTQNNNEQDFIVNRAKSLRETIAEVDKEDFGRIGIYKKLAEKRFCKLDAAIDVAILELSISKVDEKKEEHRTASED